MTVRTAFTINTAFALAFALGFLLFPEPLLSIFGITSDPATTYVARLLGTTLIGISVIVWYARDIRDTPSLRAILLGLLIFNLIAAVVTVLAVLTGEVNVLGWLLVAVLLLEALPRIYFLFIKPSSI